MNYSPDYMVCVDCYMFVVGNESDNVDEYGIIAETGLRVVAFLDGLTLISGDSRDDEAFSRSSCDGCASDLSGARYAINDVDADHPTSDELYSSYVAECEDEECGALTLHMWEIHDRPRGPLG